MYGDEFTLGAVRGRHARDAPWLTQTAVDMPALREHGASSEVHAVY